MWVEDQYNIFRTVVAATSDLSSSDEIFFSLIGPRKGVSIIFDDAEFHEIGADAPPCNELIVNGNIKVRIVSYLMIIICFQQSFLSHFL